MSIRKMIFLLEAIMAVIVCGACGAKTTIAEETKEDVNNYALTEQLTLGAQYLEEIRYEEALAVYNQILQIAGEDADAYLGIAEVYIRQGEYDTALEYAQKGYEITGDGRLLAMSEMIESGNIVDSKNRILRETVYDENGKVQWWYQYTYDKKGREDTVSHYGADGTRLGQVKCQYDEDGNQIVKEGYTFETGVLSRIICEYENNLCVKEDWYTLALELESSNTYKYNAQGLVIQEKQYDGDGNLELMYQKEYDKNGKLIQEKLYEADGSFFESRTYEYDSKGNCIKVLDYDANNQLKMSRIYNYDANGKYISESVYDEDGRLIQETKIN